MAPYSTFFCLPDYAYYHRRSRVAPRGLQSTKPATTTLTCAVASRGVSHLPFSVRTCAPSVNLCCRRRATPPPIVPGSWRWLAQPSLNSVDVDGGLQAWRRAVRPYHSCCTFTRTVLLLRHLPYGEMLRKRAWAGAAASMRQTLSLPRAGCSAFCARFYPSLNSVRAWQDISFYRCAFSSARRARTFGACQTFLFWCETCRDSALLP